MPTDSNFVSISFHPPPSLSLSLVLSLFFFLAQTLPLVLCAIFVCCLHHQHRRRHHYHRPHYEMAFKYSKRMCRARAHARTHARTHSHIRFTHVLQHSAFRASVCVSGAMVLHFNEIYFISMNLMYLSMHLIRSFPIYLYHSLFPIRYFSCYAVLYAPKVILWMDYFMRQTQKKKNGPNSLRSTNMRMWLLYYSPKCRQTNEEQSVSFCCLDCRFVSNGYYSDISF